MFFCWDRFCRYYWKKMRQRMRDQRRNISSSKFPPRLRSARKNKIHSKFHDQARQTRMARFPYPELHTSRFPYQNAAFTHRNLSVHIYQQLPPSGEQLYIVYCMIILLTQCCPGVESLPPHLSVCHLATAYTLLDVNQRLLNANRYARIYPYST